ncbi:hypothetical protein ACFC1B_27005 [Streptomyces xiamenensis]|uniref:hypothetical protein n=1 Tax=Streptomyces xiamenensis TaxID=408015 RepID=UPI0035DDDCE7
MATTEPTHPPHPFCRAVPAAGRHASCQVTPAMHDDLALLKRAGMTLTEALRLGVELVAQAHRQAWDHGDVPDGERVEVIDVRYRMADGRPSPVPVPRPALPTVTVP